MKEQNEKLKVTVLNRLRHIEEVIQWMRADLNHDSFDEFAIDMYNFSQYSSDMQETCENFKFKTE
jgi:hypothetical protein